MCTGSVLDVSIISYKLKIYIYYFREAKDTYVWFQMGTRNIHIG